MLYILPTLLNASMLALLSTSIPLFTIVTSILLAVQREGSIVADPPIHILEKASSVHAFAFSTEGALVMVESEGSFNFDTWTAASQTAESKCREKRLETSGEDFPMIVAGDLSIGGLLRNVVATEVHTAEKWRTNGL